MKRSFFHPALEALKGEVLLGDSFKGRNPPLEDMVEAGKPRILKSGHLSWPFHNEEETAIPIGILTDLTGILLVKVGADRADPHLLFRHLDGVSKIQGLRIGDLDQIVGETLGSYLAYSWESAKSFTEPVQSLGAGMTRHGIRSSFQEG